MTDSVEVTSLPISALRPSPYQRRASSEPDTGLVASVKEHGVIEPLVVRFLRCETCCGEGQVIGHDNGSFIPCPTCDGRFDRYEIMAGHRRHRAAQRAKLDSVPVVVREATDAEAAAIVDAENRHRLQLSPLEEAATVAVALAAHGGNVSHTARALGLSRQVVMRRARLTALSSAWRAAATDSSSVVSGWGARHLEVIARDPEAEQEALYRDMSFEGLPVHPTVKGLEARTARRRRALSSAPWDLADADLLPEAGACTACPKRASREKLLFAELESAVKAGEDTCLDRTCWETKTDAHVMRSAAAHQNTDSRPLPLVLLRVNHYPKGAAGIPVLADQASDAGLWEAVSADQEGAPGVYLTLAVDGPQRGARGLARRIQPTSATGGQRSTAAALPKIGRPSKAEVARRKELEAGCEKVIEALLHAEPPEIEEVAALLTLAVDADHGDLRGQLHLCRSLVASLSPEDTALAARRALWRLAAVRLAAVVHGIKDLDQRAAAAEVIEDLQTVRAYLGERVDKVWS